MTTKLTRANVPMSRRIPYRNTITFPSALRAAIPDLPTCVGRVLALDSMSGHAWNTPMFGPRVQLKLVTKETGKLKGEFTVRVDLDPEAARALAATLTQLADQVAKPA